LLAVSSQWQGLEFNPQFMNPQFIIVLGIRVYEARELQSTIETIKIEAFYPSVYPFY